MVYALICPINKDIKYIGQTSMLLKYRVRKHISDADRNYKKRKWLEELIKNNLYPEVKLLRTFNNRKSASRSEIFYIKLFGKINEGGILFNIAPGGHGDYSEESYKSLVKKARERLLGTKQTPEFIEKRVSKTRGRIMKPEQRLNLSIKQKEKFANGTLKIPSTKGRKMAEWEVERIRKRNTGIPKTPESLQKQSDSSSVEDVYQLNLDKTLFKIHKGMRQAARTGFTYELVKRSCDSKGRKMHKGFHFIKKSDYENL